MNKELKNIVIIFGKEERSTFNRYSFPILGRAVSSYPIIAALNALTVDRVFVSTDSKELINICKYIKDVELIVRDKSQPTLTEEIKNAVSKVLQVLNAKPFAITVLLANSPCVDANLIDEAVAILETDDTISSVVSAMKRSEFSPSKMFTLNDNNKLNKINEEYIEKRDIYFLDRRVIVIRTDFILQSDQKSDHLEALLGSNIHPIIQQEGIWDIDYIWQVPIVEMWLRSKGYSDSNIPYKRKIQIVLENFRDESHKVINPVLTKKHKILITTVPFGQVDPTPLDLLNKNPNIEYLINPLNRKLREDELAEMIDDFEIIIAGTEKISRKVMQAGKKLKMISRVGIGLDSVDLKAAQEMGIQVSYTPEAPAPAVAELTIAHMINILRAIPLVDRKLRSGIWQRYQGERLANSVVGIIGTGRVGSRVLKHLQGFHPKKILVNDLLPDYQLYEMYQAELVDKNFIYRNSDIITLHVPLTELTYNLITSAEIEKMKETVSLINTSRGGIINESDLYNALKQKRIKAAAIDVFETEPYTGNLTELENCYLTCHMGSMTWDCRSKMELLATEEACRFVNGEELQNLVPEKEYAFVK